MRAVRKRTQERRKNTHTYSSFFFPLLFLFLSLSLSLSGRRPQLARCSHHVQHLEDSTDTRHVGPPRRRGPCPLLPPGSARHERIQEQKL